MRNPEELKKRLRLLMARDDVNTLTLAKRLGFAEATIRKLLTDPRRPTVSTLQTIAVEFGVSIPWLLGQEPMGDVLEKGNGGTTKS